MAWLALENTAHSENCPFKERLEWGLMLGVTPWIGIVGFFILVKSKCSVLFISTYKGLIAIRHVGGISGREQEME